MENIKKAGIVTLFGEYNFGNRLQNYAVQEVLKKNELDVKTIKYIGKNDDVAKTENEIHLSRLEKFKKFNSDNIVFEEEILYREEEVSNFFEENYDYIVMGSDQIWNYTFDTIFSEKALGAFMPKQKKFSLSASIGVSKAPEKDTELYEMYKEKIEDIGAISVREEAGKEIIEEMTGRKDVVVLLDPTMMLSEKKWEKVMKKPEGMGNRKYILKTFLGNNDSEVVKEMERVARENDCDIIDISNSDSPYYSMGPAEFLWLEQNAFLVMTDSFHACVFSIIFNTPFVVIKRDDNKLESMHSRIETLTGKFGLEDRIIEKEIPNNLLKADYTNAQEIIKSEIEKADEYIQKAMKIGE